MSDMVKRVSEVLSKFFDDTLNCDDMARAAIKAMRNPSRELTEIGAHAYDLGDPDDYVMPTGICDAWNAMIDAILSEDQQ